MRPVVLDMGGSPDYWNSMVQVPKHGLPGGVWLSSWELKSHLTSADILWRLVASSQPKHTKTLGGFREQGSSFKETVGIGKMGGKMFDRVQRCAQAVTDCIIWKLSPANLRHWRDAQVWCFWIDSDKSRIPGFHAARMRKRCLHNTLGPQNHEKWRL